MNQPIARVAGYYAGRCVIQPIDPAAALSEGLALYAAATPTQPDAGVLVEAEKAIRDFESGNWHGSRGYHAGLLKAASIVAALAGDKQPADLNSDAAALTAAPAAPVVQAEQEPVAQKILDLILAECKYWHCRDEARRGGFAALYAKAKEVADADPLAHPDAVLMEALRNMLAAFDNPIARRKLGSEFSQQAIESAHAALAGKGGE